MPTECQNGDKIQETQEEMETQSMGTQGTETRPIRVLLVDDHSVMRDGLRLMLELSGEFEVVGQARDGEEAVDAAASESSPDVVVMDVHDAQQGRGGGLPGDHGKPRRIPGSSCSRPPPRRTR